MTTALIETRDGLRPDAELAHAAGRGDVAAFEALYERHHRALLSFARHMLGRVHDAEDVVQHTFVAADAAFRGGRIPKSVRAWLYTVARNRCVSILRARRDDQELPGPGVPSAENLAEEVEQREDLRALLADLRTLPEDQRAALLLAELGELSHAEVAQVLGVRPRKVKALVYQARQALMAAAGARAIPCRTIREELAVATGAARRRRHLRDHLARCDGCRAYAAGVAAQRASIAAILPVAPTIALREGVLAYLGGGGTAATAAAGGTGAGIGAVGAKLLAVAAIGGAAAGGGAVAVTAPDAPRNEPAAARAAETAPRAPATPDLAAPADAPVVLRAQADAPVVLRAQHPRPEPARSAPRRRSDAAAGERRAQRSRPAAAGERRAELSAPAARERRAGKPAEPPGRAIGRSAPNGGKPAEPPGRSAPKAGKPAEPRGRAISHSPAMPERAARAKPPQHVRSPAAAPNAGTPTPSGQAKRSGTASPEPLTLGQANRAPGQLKEE